MGILMIILVWEKEQRGGMKNENQGCDDEESSYCG
jgi:hypothetical protein